MGELTPTQLTVTALKTETEVTERLQNARAVEPEPLIEDGTGAHLNGGNARRAC